MSSSSPQKELPFQFAPADANVVWLETLLKGHGGWMTRRDIELTSGGRVGDRDIRALASASDKIISGQKGYRAIEHASPEEIHHASAWLVAQGKKMIKRGMAIQRNGHRIIG